MCIYMCVYIYIYIYIYQVLRLDALACALDPKWPQYEILDSTTYNSWTYPLDH